ncbi:MAG: type Z 30S ribosomal protein S14 [Nitrospirae bacterium]|nr:type Z 30S ribosomal protein S14 [Nitrospirota bacterium]
MARTALINKSKQPQKFPVRQYHRCGVCGRVRGFMRKFKLCRICFRNYSLRGDIPGVVKSSW